MIFVDSGAWYARVVPDDIDHLAAKTWFEQNIDPLLTTDYVVDETLTLLRARGEARKAVLMGEMFFGSSGVHLHFLTESEIRETWQMFRSYSDKDWSFTDCSSKYICEKYDITHALSFDKHFRQFGTVTIVP